MIFNSQIYIQMKVKMSIYMKEREIPYVHLLQKLLYRKDEKRDTKFLVFVRSFS
jgi:hypothetical protein